MQIQKEQPPVISTPSYAEKQFLHTQTAAVFVPLLQSAVTGLIVFVICLVIALKVNARDVFSWPLVFGIVTFGCVWLMLQTRWITLTNIERMIGRDLNGDKLIGKPEQATAPKVIRIEHIESGRYSSRDIRLTASEEQLFKLAEGFHLGRAFAEKEWTPQSKGFSTAEFRTLRAEMIKGGLIELKNGGEPRQGFKLTADGEKWVESYLAPSPTDG